MTQPEMHIDGGVSIGDVRRAGDRIRHLAGQLQYANDADLALALSRELRAEVASLHPVQNRNDRDPQVSTANTLIELLGEVRHIRAALEALNEGAALFQGAAASRSSVQLEQGAKEVRLVVKLYADSPLGTLGDEAVAEFGRLFRLIEQRQMAGWAETVEAVRNGV